MKECSICGEVKSISDFKKSKKRNGSYFLKAECKICSSKATAKWKKTKKGVALVIYYNQKGNSKSRGHRPPEYTREELEEWLFSQTKFHELHKEWEKSGYKKDLYPSVDRKCDDVHYCFNNIELKTFRENYMKDNAGRFKKNDGREKDRGRKTTKKVIQLSVNGDFIKEFKSEAEAVKQTGIKQASINKVINGKRNTAGGFKWLSKD